MQKTALTPYFESSAKSIVRILKQPSAVLYKYFYKNMDIALQKLGANAFTKTVRKLMDNDKVFLGYSATSVTSEVPVYSIYVGDSHILAGIIPDIVRCSPDSASDMIDIIRKLENNYKEIMKLQKRIDDAAYEKIAKLKEENEKAQIELASMIDYPRVAEAIYFSFIRYIVAEIDKGSSAKLFDLAVQLFKKIITDIITPITTIENKNIYNAALDYIFTVSFTNLTPRDVLHNLAKRYGEDIVEQLQNIKISQINSIDKLPALLSAIKVINITPIALNNLINKKYGTVVLTMLYATYDYFIAWATLTAHYSSLFKMGPIDKELQSEIEKIVLNYKSKVRI